MKIPNIRIYPARKKSKKSALVARAYFNGETFTDTLGISITPSAWIESKMMLNNRDKLASTVNEEVFNYKRNLESIVIELQKKNRLSVQNVKRALKKGVVKDKTTKKYDSDDYFQLVKYELIPSKRKIKSKTITAYNSTSVPLKEYVKFYYPHNDNNLSIMDMNSPDFYDEFLDFMKKGMNYAIGTMDKHIKNIKMVLRYAYKKGYLTTKEFEDFERLDTKSEPLYLSMEELKEIADTTMPSESLENVQDWLIISCFTGLRISDFMNLPKDSIDFKDNMISTVNEKTGEFVKIPIHINVKNIFKKRNWELPRKISDQKYNQYAKEVCEIAKINTKVYTLRKNGKEYCPKYKLVSSHIGRRSFATNCYINNWLEPEKLKKVTGHSSVEMLMKYIRIEKTMVAKELDSKWNDARFIF
ncbi:MAG: site-specific integrase [Flavobacteriales bacterium]|jgi:integrase|nr:site-specific integrase [Flavobacteriales bacterium]